MKQRMETPSHGGAKRVRSRLAFFALDVQSGVTKIAGEPNIRVTRTFDDPKFDKAQTGKNLPEF